MERQIDIHHTDGDGYGVSRNRHIQLVSLTACSHFVYVQGRRPRRLPTEIKKPLAITADFLIAEMQCMRRVAAVHLPSKMIIRVKFKLNQLQCFDHAIGATHIGKGSTKSAAARFHI